jgi:glycolate oxidase
LLSLFVGSEGTLGVITQATLRLVPRPAHRRLLWASFAQEEAALAAVSLLFGAGPEPSACEFLERAAAEVSARSLDLRLPADADAHLFVEADGF